MSHFPRYDSYKGSGIDWLGEIPVHWDLCPLRAITELKSERNKPDLPVLSVYREYGVILKDSRDDNHNATSLDTSNYKVVRKGDLVVNKMKAWQGSMGVSEYDGIVSPAYITCYVNQQMIVPKYLHYLLRSKVYVGIYNALSYGVRIGQWDMHYEDFKKIPIPLPTKKEQDRIVAFLDEKTAAIDEAIAKKRRLIELLQEQKAILINTAVTQGLDPYAPMKESGVEWIGRIPAHWEVSRSKWLFTVRNERARPDDEQLSATQAYGVISQQEYMRKEGRKVTQITQHLEKRRHVEVDDFVISMRSFQGGLERAWATGCIRSSYVVLQPTPQTNPDFFAYLFKSYRYIQALRATSNFIRDGQDLNFNNFALVDLPVIPLEEQKAIASYLDEVIADLANTSEIVQREINLLSEYRICLIAEAVTGKIKI